MKEMSQVEITVLSVKEDMICIIADSFNDLTLKPTERWNHATVATHMWLLNTTQRAAKNEGSVRFAT